MKTPIFPGPGAEAALFFGCTRVHKGAQACINGHFCGVALAGTGSPLQLSANRPMSMNIRPFPATSPTYNNNCVTQHISRYRPGWTLILRKTKLAACRDFTDARAILGVLQRSGGGRPAVCQILRFRPIVSDRRQSGKRKTRNCNRRRGPQALAMVKKWRQKNETGPLRSIGKLYYLFASDFSAPRAFKRTLTPVDNGSRIHFSMKMSNTF